MKFIIKNFNIKINLKTLFKLILIVFTLITKLLTSSIHKNQKITKIKNFKTGFKKESLINTANRQNKSEEKCKTKINYK